MSGRSALTPNCRSYVRETAGSGGHAEELSRLAALKDRGAITEAEFAQAKAKVLAT
ncbi:SHOCT domain-containing protein [Streptomyces sp. NPDC090022]|uniref:SHOCT domain-containing protein n=1 Tax=Streptomyces sp. NPDC090022 TaxID=3365920 RepID=UPI00382BD5A8